MCIWKHSVWRAIWRAEWPLPLSPYMAALKMEVIQPRVGGTGIEPNSLLVWKSHQTELNNYSFPHLRPWSRLHLFPNADVSTMTLFYVSNYGKTIWNIQPTSVLTEVPKAPELSYIIWMCSIIKENCAVVVIQPSICPFSRYYCLIANLHSCTYLAQAVFYCSCTDQISSLIHSVNYILLFYCV